MAAPRIISKTFQYQNDLRWKFERVGNIASEGKPALQISSPAAFKGEADDWTSEDLLVAAANACLLLTFLAYVEREHIAVTSYESTASGTVEGVGGKYQFTEITIRPRVELEDSSYAPQVEESLRRAERNCLIANSISAAVQEVAVEYLPRIGTSKISGNLWNSLRAGLKILWTIARLRKARFD